MKRNDYRTTLKAMTKEQLKKYIDRKYDLMLSGCEDGSTPTLTKIIYAEKLLAESSREIRL
jgi:hypothetical protein